MTGENHIGFNLSSKSNACFQAVDPSTGQNLDVTFFKASPEEVDQAVELAVQAFKVFHKTSVYERSIFLKTIGEELYAIAEELLDRYVLESGLSRQRGRIELERTVIQLNSYGEDLEKCEVLGLSIDLEDNKLEMPRPDIRKMNVALGPVVVFGASNFPLAYSTAGGDTASALAAGCPVIVKAHPLHPGTSRLVADAILKAAKRTGMPDGVFSHLFDDSFEVGQQLVLHEGVKAVGFTGSFKGGMALWKLANSRKIPIPVFAEMGSVNPIVVLPSALKNDSSEIASKIALSVTRDAGQFCTKPGVIFVKEGRDLDFFVHQLNDKVKSAFPQTMLSQSIHSAYVTGVETLFQLAEKTIVPEHDLKRANGSSALLEVSQKQFLGHERFAEEVFGPSSVVVRYLDDEGLEQCLNKLNGQLTCSVFGETSDIQNRSKLLDQLQANAGRVIVNGVPTGVTVCASMQHGGPFPATTDARFSAVGSDAILRFLRPVAFQNYPDELLPFLLKDDNPAGVLRRINGVHTKEAVVHKKD